MTSPIAAIAAASLLLTCSLHGQQVKPPANQAGQAEVKPLAGEFPVKLPAATLQTNPLKLGTVAAGHKVTVTSVKVQWSGGGSKQGVFCDWRGHNPDKPLANGIPWMALVVAVGKKQYWPKAKSSFSFTVREAGELVLYANDEQGGNIGEAEIVVKVSPN